MKTPLPIDAHLGHIVSVVDEAGAAVVVAPPGAGKSTRVPPALLGAGPVILLQPRRVAARAVAERIAAEEGVRVGDEVGWHVRFERRASARTRLLVVTEGLLTRRLQDDPLLEEVGTVVLDEFHERSVHADLAIALLREAQRGNPRLRLVVMSATLDPGPVATFLGGCPVVTVDAAEHPVAVSYAPGLSPADAVRRVLGAPGGDVLVFLPGAPEIRRVEEELGSVDADVLPLHGSLDASAQARALLPGPRRRVVLATNVAETSLTLEGVTDVVDTGLHKVLRHDPATGLDRLGIERIPADSAAQRAGRAGRTAPGRALRLWDERDRLAPQREPELHHVDLARPVLDVACWGGDPTTFEWFDAPPAERVAAAVALLQQLGALDATRRATALGRELQREPLHPRLARLLLADGRSPRAAAACALLAESRALRAPGLSTRSDLLSLADRIDDAPWPVRQAARQLATGRRSTTEEGFLRAVLAAYPDRVARRREGGDGRVLLASGRGGRLARESGVADEFLVAVDVTDGAGADALVRLASGVEKDWLTPDRVDVVHTLDDDGVVRARERRMLGAVVLGERQVAPAAAQAADLLAAHLDERGLGPENDVTVRRLRFARLEVDLHSILREALAGQVRVPAFDLSAALPWSVRAELDRRAPRTLPVPSGRYVALDYAEDGTVSAAVKLQELFGLAESPRLGPAAVPVTFALLSPAGRPVQLTRDLASFWRTTYPEVRKELRGRYPRHPWPEDPWTATPTARTKKRGSPR